MSSRWRLVLREVWRHLPLSFRKGWGVGWMYVLNLALGLSAMLALESLKTSIHNTFEGRAREVLAGDLSVSARREISEQEIDLVRKSLPGQVRETVVYELFAMLAPMTDKEKDAGNTRLVMVKAIDDAYPLYGKLDLSGGRAISSESSKMSLQQKGIWISSELETELGLSSGSRVKLGDQVFLVDGYIANDPSVGLRVAGLAPRVYIHRSQIAATGLLRFGSTFSKSHLFKLAKEPGNDLRRAVLGVLPDPQVQVDIPETAREDSGRQLSYLGDYLGLVALVALFIAGVGGFFVARVFVVRRKKEYAILKSLGLTDKTIIGQFSLELVVLSVLAWILAVGFASLLLPVLQVTVSAVMNQGTGQLLNLELRTDSLVMTLGIAFMVCLLLTLPLLQEIRFIKPIVLLQGQREGKRKGLRSAIQRLWWVIPSAVSFWLMAVYQSHSWRVGSAFVAALILTVGVLTLARKLTLLLAQRIFRGSWKWRYVMRDLMFRSGQVGVIITAIGLGSMLLNLLPQIKNTLQAEFSVGDKKKLPSFFAFDIQPEQEAVVKEIIQSHGLAVPKTYPIVRSRILKVNDLDFERKVESAQLAQMTREEEQEIRFRNRGLNLSFREQIGEGEELVEGSFMSQKWDKQNGKPFAVSLEKSYATRLKLQMGDRLRFDVQGIELEGIVTSIRRVRWTTFQPNFFVLVQPGVLEDAPHTLIAAIPQTDTDRKTAIQKDFSRKLSNVSLINVEKTVKDTIEILDKLSWSLEIMAVVALVGGYIVMISVMLSQWIQRRWQSSLLKSIGCGTQDLVGLSLRESILMASVGAVIGGLSSGVLASGLSYYMFDEVFAWNGKTIFLNTILIVILGILTTLFAIGYVSRSRPAELLSEFASEASSE